MIANFTENPRITKITQEFLQLTGWYDVDEALGAEINWGRDQGCGFLGKDCDHNNKSPYKEFNIQVGQSLCSSEYDFKGSAFSSSSDEYYDGCKIFRPVW